MRISVLVLLCALPLAAADADLILHNGRIVTVDKAFTIAEAVAVKGGYISRVGTSQEVLANERGVRTKVINLEGKMVLPGLIDAHVHALESGLSEFRSPVPPLNSIAAIQDYIREKAKSTPRGRWIVVPRTLPPRLTEMRFPTKADLDVTTDHPVAFDGSYVWGANSMALRISGITKDTPNPPGGEIVKGPDGEPNGILRNASRLLKDVTKAEPFTEQEKQDALEKMLRLYAEAGLTGVGDRAVTPSEAAIFEKLKVRKRMATRVALTWRINTTRPLDEIVKEINTSKWTTGQGDEWLKVVTFKVTLDGGQSVGTAYQRMPYGPFGRQLYGQTNPDARGNLFVEPEKLYGIFHAAHARGWQMTAHVQGGAAIDTLLDTFERLDKEKPIAPSRSHVMHGSFMSEEALNRMQKMGILADVQPAWLYYDVPALKRVFGLENMRWFFPLRSIIDRGIIAAGGSDHMMGHDRDRAVNAYNPFFNMWMAVTRQTRLGETIYPQERVTREQALKMYTIWAAHIMFSERVRGSIERGKLADMVLIDRDFLKCSESELRMIRPLTTYVEGKPVYELK